MKLALPLSDRRWRAALRLATLSMLITIALLAAIGNGFSTFRSRGYLLAQFGTDRPVLASDVQWRRERPRLGAFRLTGEGGRTTARRFHS